MLTYGPVTLRPMEERDMVFLRELLNDPEIASSVVDYGFPVSSTQQNEWFIKNSQDHRAIRYIVEAGGADVGSLVFGKIDMENKTMELGYKIARAFQGNHYAFYAIRAALDFLFYEKGIECIIVYHLQDNHASRRTIEKSGFIYEGTMRSAVYKNGKRQDLICWSCNREYYEKTAKDLV